MFTRILTALERRRIKTYLMQDGERDVPIRKLVNRGKTFLPQIESDLVLVKGLLERYEWNKRESSSRAHAEQKHARKERSVRFSGPKDSEGSETKYG